MDNETADSVFRRFTESAARGETAGIEQACARHPDLADELRHLHADWIFEDIADGVGASVHTTCGAAGSDGWGYLLERIRNNDEKWKRYDVRGEIGRGGMGAVLCVYDKDLLRTLAMKVIRPHSHEPIELGRSPPTDDRTLGRFIEEAQISSQLDHPGIVPIHDLGVDAEGHAFFTMKLVRGENLKSIFDKVALGIDGWNVTRALSVLLRVCEAMAYAHAKGVIHRDLKPANVMVGRFGEVYVMDWGLARILGDSSRTSASTMGAQVSDEFTSVRSDRRIQIDATPRSQFVTLDGDVMGTPAYMSPEQAAGQLDELGAPSDVYSIGAILYELLAGHIPYVRLTDSISHRTLLALVLSGPPHPLGVEAPEAPAELVAICEKAMARERWDRYPDPQALADDLRAYLEQRVVLAYETGAVAELRKWVSRNRKLATTAAAAIIAVVALAGWALRERGIAKDHAASALAFSRESAANAREARQNATTASARAADATARKAEFDQLAGVVYLQEAIAKEEQLYPPWPEQIAAMETWLQTDAARLSALKPVLVSTIAQLESRAVRRTAEESEALRRARAIAPDLEDQSHAIDPIEVELPGSSTWHFADESQSFLHSTLFELATKIDEFQRVQEASVRERLEWAKRIGDLTLHHPNARSSWQQARDAIALADDRTASALYRNYPIDLSPQPGMVPIGMNPVTKFWEFYDLRSACEIAAGCDPAAIEIPVHDAEGNIEVKDGTGIVFVLLPGGAFTLGAQRSDRTQSNYDPDAMPDEAPLTPLSLAPFFLARHELTRAQWFRLSNGEEPSWYERNIPLEGNAATIGWTHPVEYVSWTRCEALLRHSGLSLPTEAQWEYAARGGTSTVWWTGADLSLLANAANVLDRSAASRNTGTNRGFDDLDDGFSLVAPVGRFRCNAFGLFDMNGNVMEWCRDWYGPYTLTHREQDGLRQWASPTGVAGRVIRGGSFDTPASTSRSAARYRNDSEVRSNGRGCRASRALRP